MRNAFFLLILFISDAHAQLQSTDQVPDSIKLEFIEDFISAKNINWRHLDANTYAVTFFHQSQEKKVTYSLDKIQSPKLETRLTSLFQVPPSVADKITSRFRKFVIVEMRSIEEPGGEPLFAFVLLKEAKLYELIISESGKLVTRRQVPSDYKPI